MSKSSNASCGKREARFCEWRVVNKRFTMQFLQKREARFCEWRVVNKSAKRGNDND